MGDYVSVLHYQPPSQPIRMSFIIAINQNECAANSKVRGLLSPIIEATYLSIFKTENLCFIHSELNLTMFNKSNHNYFTMLYNFGWISKLSKTKHLFSVLKMTVIREWP